MARARLSMAFEDMRGGIGEESLVRTRYGLVVRRKPTYRRQQPAALVEASARMKALGVLWATLGASEAAEWRRFAEGQRRRARVTGEVYSPTARNVFMGLSVKLLQVDPDRPVPLLPPTTPFGGDTVVLQVAGLPGRVRFTASAPNGPDTTTELLVQRLANPRRSPTSRYANLAFHPFAPGSLSVEEPLAPGVYAFAYRFVRPSTGEMSGLRRLGVVEV